MTGPDHLRVGDAERDEVAVALHDHFVRGRLTRDELDERLEQALSAKTAGDLREVTRDLPGPESRPDQHLTEPGHGADLHEPGVSRAGPHWPGPRPPGPYRTGHRHGGGLRRRRHHHLHAAPLLLGIFLIAAVAAGAGDLAFFGVVQVMFLIWLVIAVLANVRHRRWHRGR